jgi:hypothetical protein
MRSVKLLSAIILFTAMLSGACAAAWAAPPGYEDGAYIAPTNTYYLNPDTGVTDDGGSKNAALGEGMCRSVVYKDALVEFNGDKIYATVRLQLMSNMKDFRLYVQDGAGDSYTKESPRSYSKVAPRVMTEDAGADTTDYRFEIPSVTAYMSWEMYVIPMGRDVKFYMNLSDDLTPGGGDFVVSVKPKASPTPTQSPTPAPEESPVTGAPTPTSTPQITPTASETSAPPASISPELPPEAAPSAEASSAPSETPSGGAVAPSGAAAPPASGGGELPDKTPPPVGVGETEDVRGETPEDPEPSQGSGHEPDTQTSSPSDDAPQASAGGALADDDSSPEISPDESDDSGSASGAGGIILAVAVIAVAGAAVIAVPRIVRKRK